MKWARRPPNRFHQLSMMRMPRELLQDSMKRQLDPSVPLVLTRIVFRLLILLLFSALAVAPGVGFMRMFTTLAAVNGGICIVWALLRREQPWGRGLTHWDEALVMIFLWLLVGVKA